MSRETFPHLEALREEMRRMNIDAGIIPTRPIETDGKVDVQVSEDKTVSVKDFSKFFDIDYLRTLLEK